MNSLLYSLGQATIAEHRWEILLLAFMACVVISSCFIIVFQLSQILSLLERLQPITNVRIFQRKGAKLMAITGITVGGQGTFQVEPVPSTASLPQGVTPQWTASDPSISLAASSDGTSVVASVPAGSTLTTFNLTVVVGSFQDTVPVPVITPLTGVTITQTA
jgi:hypothetical protein